MNEDKTLRIGRLLLQVGGVVDGGQDIILATNYHDDPLFGLVLKISQITSFGQER